MKSIASLSQLPADYCIALSDYSAIRVTGGDAGTYLHGQLTVNTQQFNEDSARWSAHCDFKGKTWAIQLVVKNPQGYTLVSPESATLASAEQLKKYGVFSKVDIEVQKPEQYVIKGKRLLSFVEEWFGAVPTSSMATLNRDDSFCVRLSPLEDHLWLVLDEHASQAFSGFCDAADIAILEQVVFEALATQHGLPVVTGDNINQFVPQMMNLQALDAIDFDKGCYMGQEVVARTRYLGKNKRATYPLYTNHCVNAAIGGSIEKQVGENWRRGGTVLRCANLADETWVLAVLANDTQPADILRVSEDEQTPLEAKRIPYAIE